MAAPEPSRTVEKLAASILPSPRARRQSTEFAAKATRENPVHTAVHRRLASVLTGIVASENTPGNFPDQQKSPESLASGLMLPPLWVARAGKIDSLECLSDSSPLVRALERYFPGSVATLMAVIP